MGSVKTQITEVRLQPGRTHSRDFGPTRAENEARYFRARVKVVP